MTGPKIGPAIGAPLAAWLVLSYDWRMIVLILGLGGPAGLRKVGYNPNMLHRLPGNDLISQGIEDLSRGVESVPALLVSIGAPRLRFSNVPVPDTVFPSPELRLYERLSRVDPDGAHSKYNALIRRLVSFERAVECVS